MIEVWGQCTISPTYALELPTGNDSTFRFGECVNRLKFRSQYQEISTDEYFPGVIGAAYCVGRQDHIHTVVCATIVVERSLRTSCGLVLSQCWRTHQRRSSRHCCSWRWPSTEFRLTYRDGKSALCSQTRHLALPRELYMLTDTSRTPTDCGWKLSWDLCKNLSFECVVSVVRLSGSVRANQHWTAVAHSCSELNSSSELRNIGSRDRVGVCNLCAVLLFLCV